MPMVERCGMCAHFKVIEGIFGECKEKDTVFSADPKCDVFLLNQKKVADNAEHNQEEPKSEETEWENPLYRKKKKPRKVINLAEAIAERKNK